VIAILSVLVGFGSALLAIFLTPQLQHFFWQRQRRAELQIDTANDVNKIAANFYITASAAVDWGLSSEFLAEILVVRGKVTALFSEPTIKQFEAMHNLFAANSSRARGLGPQGNSGKYEILEIADKAVRMMYEEAVGKDHWKKRI
jgi:hypothetical protein